MDNLQIKLILFFCSFQIQIRQTHCLSMKCFNAIDFKHLAFVCSFVANEKTREIMLL